jgi:pimeloyl-ACP methyl ester carboxylesterase
LVAQLGKIRCPTLVMVGALDTEFLEPSEQLARGIPDAELAVLPEAGHQPQNEAAAAWFEAVRAHLVRASA